jgi:hypothetical protein
MNISPIDWAIVISYIFFALGLGIYFSKRAGKNINEFFISGRNLPWWLAGTSMVATTFAADTPLAVTGIVVEDGIAGNWLWWNAVLSGMLATFLFFTIMATFRNHHRCRIYRTPLLRTFCKFPARFPCFIYRFTDQLHYNGVGNPCNAENCCAYLQPTG